jgi:CubicO group peptidase (beta-lactamase class C family)
MTTSFRVLAAVLIIVIGSLHALAGDVPLTRAEDVDMSTEHLQELVRRLEILIDEGRTSGIQILIARRGKVVLHENLGLADIQSGKPIDDNTLFRIHSMTKPITATAMMLLHEAGHFSFADPIATHIPEFERLRVYVGTSKQGEVILEDLVREPTILDLMQHTAGFSYGENDHPVDQMYGDANILDDDAPLQAMIDKLAEIPLRFQPGTQWYYSYSVDIQGYLVEKWSGQGLGQFLKERVFDPLAMDETTAWVTPDKADLMATVYSHNDAGKLVPSTDSINERAFRRTARFMGGDQLISTSDDYWRFSQMLLNGGQFHGKRILSQESVSTMISDQLADDIELSRPWIGFGFNGMVVTDASKATMAWSNGTYSWGGTANTVFWIDPEIELVAVFLTQYRPWDVAFYQRLLGPLVRAAIIK